MPQLEGGWEAGRLDTLNDAFRRAATEHADQPFLDFSGETFTYAQFWERTCCLADGFARLGVSPGDRVASILDNSPDALLTWFAVNLLGGISVPINTAYKGEFLRHPIAESGARIVVAESDYCERVLDIAAELPEVERILHRGDPPTSSAPRALAIAPLDEHFGDHGAFQPVEVAPSDLSLLIFTSGTTGPSKGCMISHNFVCYLAHLFNLTTTRQADELYWTPHPLFHLNASVGAVVGSMLLGGTCSVYPRFSLSTFWPEIERTGARIVTPLGVMVPLIAQMDDTPELERCRGQIRVAVGAPFPPALANVWKERFGVQLVGSNGYGSSEVGIPLMLPADQPAREGSNGKVTADFDVRVVDDADVQVATGEVGEIVVRPLRPHVMFEGYWGRPEATLAAFRNLWFHTGDLGRFDDEGYFYFVDRKKDYLRRGGENISSAEMEAVFLQHADVAEVAVHAVTSPLTEDDVKVTAVLVDGSALSPEELCRWSIERVPYFAVPRYVEFRDELPKNAVGRVLKYQLRAEGATDSTWDRAASDLVVERR